jgi:predicted transcriptional regulator of viral defense system
MNLLKYKILEASPIFTTRDFAIQCNISVSASARILSRISKEKEIRSITKGLWTSGNESIVHAFSISPYLLGKHNGYISLLSALHIHGVLSQIPTRTQVITTAHSRTIKTKLGVFEFFQMTQLTDTDSVVWSNTPIPFRIATPEKALLDIFYLSTRKGKRFASLPELELKENGFKKKKFLSLLEKHNFPVPIHNAILNRFEGLNF